MRELFFLLFLSTLFSCREKQNSGFDDTITNAESQPQKSQAHPLNSVPTHYAETVQKLTACNWKSARQSERLQKRRVVFSRTYEDDFVYIFQKNGAIEYPTKDFGDCPVGALTLKEGTWTLDGNQLTLELKGLKISDYWYWRKVRYNILELTYETLALEVDSVFKNKSIDPTKSWEDLLRE